MRIMRYLKGIEEYSLYYKKNEKLELRAYTDADWARNIDDRKSTSGGAFSQEKDSIHGLARNNISQSTAKAKYVAATTNTQRYEGGNH